MTFEYCGPSSDVCEACKIRKADLDAGKLERDVLRNQLELAAKVASSSEDLKFVMCTHCAPSIQFFAEQLELLTGVGYEKAIEMLLKKISEG